MPKVGIKRDSLCAITPHGSMFDVRGSMFFNLTPNS